MSYTLRDAARLVASSKRTIERAVKDGDLPGRKTARGGRDVWLVDAGDLAAWAQATGRTLTDPDNPPQATPQTAAVSGADVAHEGDHDTDRQTAGADKPPQRLPQTATGDAAQAAADADRLRARVRDLEGERDFLREALATAQRTLEQATKALPEPRVSPDRRPGWWARLTGR